MLQVTAVLPARYGSTRFPGKPLALIAGKPMIQHVYERVSAAGLVSRVIVATDDQRIVDCVKSFSGEVLLTRADHPTGTDRLAEVARAIESELIVNVQGDEPLIQPQMIDHAVAPLLDNDHIQMGTLAAEIDNIEDFYSPNVVKVVRDLQNFALYFSRAPIPWPRDLKPEQIAQQLSTLGILRHIGLYVYRRSLLLDYPTWPKTPLESLENLEQLRALERGIKLYVGETGFSCHGVDTPEDLKRVEALLSAE
jgi:3-deoxy-manno-octulosonate cytidylyltransferase (CMP-KDO synthetase)